MSEENKNSPDQSFELDGAQAPIEALEKKLADENESLSSAEIEDELEKAKPTGIDYSIAQATQSTGLEHISVDDLALEDDIDETEEEQCLNCAAALKGPYCYNCGQPGRHFIRFFPKVLWDLINEALDFDSRIFRTLVPLLLFPGRLTMEYIAGRRARYVNPLRLYVFLSLIFFVSISLLTDTGDKIKFQTSDEATEGQALSPEPNSTTANSPKVTADEPADVLGIELDNGKDWDPESNPVTFDGWFSPETTKELNIYLWDLTIKLKKAIKNDSSELIDEFYNAIPQLMFFLLPIFALLLKLTYIFNRRYYMEHLIVALHSHSFIFFSLLLIILINAVTESLTGFQWLSEFLGISTMVLGIWIPINIYLTQKKVYAQSHFVTILKFIFVAFCYWSLLSITAILAFVVGLINL